MSCGHARLQGETLETRHLLAGDPLVISEFMASNAAAVRDRFREYPDWIEIHNPTDHPVALEGWALTNDPTRLQLWKFPAVSIEADGYLVVFASDRNEMDPARELHANFKLGAEHDYLALVRPDGEVANAYSPTYPPQFVDVSYGISAAAQANAVLFEYFTTPTPGKPNISETVEGRSEGVSFSVGRGYYSDPVTVELTTTQVGGAIRYTIDGSAPTLTNSQLYQQPLVISKTMTLRAAVFTDKLLRSTVGTQTYIFLQDVLKQTGEGLPKEWGFFDDQGPKRPARMRANYAMDPTVVNSSLYRGTILDDMRSLPVLSLVMDPKDLWEFTNGIYSNPERHGTAWERPVSVEYMDKAGKTLFQADAGLRIHGGWARRFTFNAKLSFRLAFRGIYGADSLDFPLFGEGGQQKFQQIVLRSGFNDSWQGGDRNNTYMQDQWTRQAQRDAGGYSSRNSYVHLYLNGLYWGMYSPTERPDADWAAANRGGNPEEYDVLNTGGSVIDGDLRAWTELTKALSRKPFNYDEIKNLVDIDSYIDYMIVNQYVGNWDWPHNNWYASRRRAPGEKWYFHSWDGEAAFQNGTGENRVSNVSGAVGPADVYLKVREVPEFKAAYADRIYKLMYNGGVLTPQANIDRLNKIAAQIDRAIVGESARWGDGRVDTTKPALTRDSAWIPRIKDLNTRYFPARGNALLGQYRAVGFYGNLTPPVYNQLGGQVTPGFGVELSTDSGGEILYTTDGSDPRSPEGTISPKAKSFNWRRLITPDSASRWLSPVGGPTEIGWQTLDFNDAAWSAGSAALGFDTGTVDDPLEVVGGFSVRHVFSTVALEDLETVDRVLNGENVKSTRTANGIKSLNFLDGTRGGIFDDNRAFPGGVGDNYAVDCTGTLSVKQAGKYTFGLTRNDGVRLEIDGKVVFADVERHTSDEVQLIPVELTAGEHSVRVVMFDRSGVGSLEFFYALGIKDAVDPAFSLVGELKHRPYQDQIKTNVQSIVAGNGTSVYTRIPFELAAARDLAHLYLRARYDDGLVVYLNGEEVARRRAPESLVFDSTATSTRTDIDAIQVEVIDLTSAMQKLKVGRNVLAVQILNGSALDPDMLFSPQLIGELSGGAIHLDASTIVKSRTFLDGVWSALAPAEFRITSPATPDSIRISEIHYNPRLPSPAEIAAGFNDADDFEFLEVVNVSSHTIDLEQVRLARVDVRGKASGVDFSFATSAMKDLGPGERIVVVRDRDAFEMRYGRAIPVAGEYQGGLGNSSETLSVYVGNVLAQQFLYSDSWSPLTDGVGAALEFYRLTDLALSDWSNSAYWQAGVVDGTPGRVPEALSGDVNRNRVFDEIDLILAFQAGNYETAKMGLSWEQGDWNGDGKFDSADLVLAFSSNTFRGNFNRQVE